MKIFTFTFGCRVNQSETESLREQLIAGGHEAVEEIASADLCLVNTCTVTRMADRDALKLLRRVRRENPLAQLVVTGCYATRAPEELRREFPDARIVGNADKTDLPTLLGCPPVSGEFKVADFNGRARAFVKIQDGCNMHCTYCIIPAIRPTLSSKPFPELRQEILGLAASGYREVVLCGIRLGRYLSVDEDGRRVDFAEAVRRLCALPGDFRIRLSSLEITDLTDRLLAILVASEGRLCPSFHLPLQSASDTVLKGMERWYSSGFYARRVEALWKASPEAGLFTDIMVGFPNETEADFEASMSFLERNRFSGLHVFRFSSRPGTPAAELTPLPDEVLIERSRRMHELDRSLRLAFARRSAGATRRVVVEDMGEAVADNFLRVRLEGDRPPPGSMVWAKVGEGGATPLASTRGVGL